MLKMATALYESLCPVCNGILSVEEVDRGRCYTKGRDLKLRLEELESFVDFFERSVGRIRSLQMFWAKRVLRGESFAAVAPTGMGKTTFGVVMACFLATLRRKSFIIVPTSLLVTQAADIVKRIGNNASVRVNPLYYHGKLPKREKEEFFNRLGRNDFDVLITTSMFLSIHFSKLKGRTFDFIFVDDVDSVLKASRNVERLLTLLGLKETRGGFVGEPRGVLMVSTATAKRGEKVKLFRQLLGFDVGLSNYTARNIADITAEKSYERLVGILRRMGGGALIFTKSAEEAERLFKELSRTFKVGIVSAKRNMFEEFRRGELDFLVGTAHYYGTLVRGIDLPERIRYVVFFGAPFFELQIEDVDRLSEGTLRTLLYVFRDDERVSRLGANAQEDEVRAVLKEVMRSPKMHVKDVAVKENKIFLPDIRTYIQGSGRSSRIHAGGITRGAAFLLEDDEDKLRAFVERAKLHDIEFRPLEEVDVEELIREIDESRRSFKSVEAFEIKPALFIVESPTKARQIARFFGMPSVRIFGGVPVYEVMTPRYVLLIATSLGHVTDLTTDVGFYGVLENEEFVPVYATIKRCRACGYQFTKGEKCVKCGSEDINDSYDRIEALRRAAWETDLVIIGTDPDSEGEKIAWDLKNLLKPFASEIKRAEFHEVTKRAVERALSELRELDERMVEAQIVRRVEDRWIGFALSQKLWEEFEDRNLSAGRAQSPVLRWIVERHEASKRRKFVLLAQELDLRIELDAPSLKRILGDAVRAGRERKVTLELEIEKVRTTVEEVEPPPPYTTDALLEDAGRILKLSASDAMRIAQSLFELGLITYHRTDSTRVSDRGLQVAKEFLQDDFSPRVWTSAGAHECIRPTRPLDRSDVARLIQENVITVSEPLSSTHFALYDLVFRRFMASQCKPFKVRKETYSMRLNGLEFQEERVVHAEGRAYELYRSVRVRSPLPEGTVRTTATLLEVPEKPPFTQSDIVRLMKERGIGRPSTYATILEKLFLRKYVYERQGRLLPTKRGISVCKYLFDNFETFVSEARTYNLEAKKDEIERGEANYQEVLRELREEIRMIESV